MSQSERNDQSYREAVASVFTILSRSVVDEIRDGTAYAVKFEWKYGDSDVLFNVTTRATAPMSFIQLDLGLGEEMQRLSSSRYQQLSFDFEERTTH